MKNSTINKLMYLYIGLLFIIIMVLSVKIIKRPHPIYDKMNDSSLVEETDAVQIEGQASAETALDDSNNEESNLTLHGKTASRVNIRELPSTDSRVLSTVEKDYTFDIIEILDSGWTKIKFAESEAYISSDFVILIQGES